MFLFIQSPISDIQFWRRIIADIWSSYKFGDNDLKSWESSTYIWNESTKFLMMLQGVLCNYSIIVDPKQILVGHNILTFVFWASHFLFWKTVLLFRYETNQDRATPLTPNIDFSPDSLGFLWSMVSKAADKSRNAISITWWLSAYTSSFMFSLIYSQSLYFRPISYFWPITLFVNGHDVIQTNF